MHITTDYTPDLKDYETLKSRQLRNTEVIVIQKVSTEWAENTVEEYLTWNI